MVAVIDERQVVRLTNLSFEVSGLTFLDLQLNSPLTNLASLFLTYNMAIKYQRLRLGICAGVLESRRRQREVACPGGRLVGVAGANPGNSPPIAMLGKREAEEELQWQRKAP